MLVALGYSQVGGQSVQADRGLDGQPRLRGILRKQPCNHSREHVAAASLSHCRITGGVDGHPPIWMRNQRPRALLYKVIPSR